jgi:hypothetical protein
MAVIKQGRQPPRVIQPTMHPMSPTLLVDEIRPQPVGGWRSVVVRVIGRGGVPVVDVAQVRLEVQFLAASSDTEVAVGASDRSPALMSALRAAPGVIKEATVVSPVAADGNITVWLDDALYLRLTLYGWAAAQPPAVRLPRFPEAFGASAFSFVDHAVSREILTNTNRYALSTWRSTVMPDMETALRENLTQPGVISIAAEAYAVALSLRTRAYDPRKVGVSAEEATALVRRLVDLVAGEHLANHPNGWGQPWLRGPCRECEYQEGLCAAFAARAAWLLWDDLSAAEKAPVVRMLEYEADRELEVPIHYLRSRTGSLLTPGNTGADELAWEASAPTLAAAMFPDADHRAAWLFKVVQFTIAAWARPQDVTSSAVVAGAPLSRWLAGSNVEPDGELVNHGRIAPDYVGEIDHTIAAVRDLILGGSAVPSVLLRNLDVLYQALTDVQHHSPPYLPPGGTVYRPRMSAVYWPMRCDWGQRQPLGFAVIDGDAVAFGFGHPSAASYLRLHALDELSMQERSQDRRSYLSPDEFSKRTAEEQTAWLAANLYLTEVLANVKVQWVDLPIWSGPFDVEYRGRDTVSDPAGYVR